MRISLPVSMSHSLRVRSSDAETALPPSGVIATALTQPACPLSVRVPYLFLRPTASRVLSQDGDARMRPSGDHASRPIWPLCPLKVWRSLKPRGILSLDLRRAIRIAS